EEAYTLSMLLEDCGLFSDWQVEIYGTDLSRLALTTARLGEYGPNALRATSQQRRARHFEASMGSKGTVAQRHRACVTVQPQNLMSPPSADALPLMDVVFCRNVLIYFDPKARKVALDSLHRRLRPGGWLLLGHSETLLTLATAFESVQLERNLVYRRAM